MRWISTAFVAVVLSVSVQPASAQELGSMPPPIPPGDMMNYCVYAGLVYSVGSQICIVRGGPPMYCEQRAGDRPSDPKPRASWTTNQPPATINCASEAAGGTPRYQPPPPQQ